MKVKAKLVVVIEGTDLVSRTGYNESFSIELKSIADDLDINDDRSIASLLGKLLNDSEDEGSEILN